MLTIQTTKNQVLISKDNGSTQSYAKNELSYSFDNVMLFISSCSDKNLYSEAFSNELTLNGDILTKDNVIQKLEKLFKLSGSNTCCTSDYDDLENRPSINGKKIEGDKDSEYYGLVKTEDLADKADNYYTENTIKLSNINVGDYLSGRLIKFDYDKELTPPNEDVRVELNNEKGTYPCTFIHGLDGKFSFTLPNGTVDLYTFEWGYEQYTVPNEDLKVTSINGNINDDEAFQASSYQKETKVNPEYNYKEVQNLKVDVESLASYNGLSVPYKNISKERIVLEPQYAHYNLHLTKDATIEIDRSIIESGKDIRFTAYFKVDDFISVRFSEDIHFHDDKTISDIGNYYYTFFYNEKSDRWLAKLDYSFISKINPGNKYFFVDGKNGNDDADGLSWHNAKKTIQAAIDGAEEGDGVMIKGYNDGFEYLPTTERIPGNITSKSFIMKNGVNLFGGCNGTEKTPNDIQMREENLVLDLPAEKTIHKIQIPVLKTILSGDMNKESILDVDNLGGCRYTSESMTGNSNLLICANVNKLTRINGCILCKVNGKATSSENMFFEISNSICSDIRHDNDVAIEGLLTNSIVEFTTGSNVVTANAKKSILRNLDSRAAILADKCELYSIKKDVCGVNSIISNCYMHDCITLVKGSESSKFNILNCRIERFRSDYLINTSTGATTQLNRCIISNCEMNNYLIQTYGLTILNTLVSNNNTSNGIINSGYRDYNLINCTIVNNTGKSFAGIPLTTHGHGYIKNCAVWGNRIGSVLSNIQLHEKMKYSNCAIEGIDNLENGNTYLSSNNQGDTDSPYFIKPSINPGITEDPTDYKISRNSALIDTGNNSYLSGENLAYDAALQNRIINDTVDIGAYEFQAINPERM